MGKAAENERIKLLAGWYNNISVGLTLTGVLIPVFSLYNVDNFVMFYQILNGRYHPYYLEGLRLVLAIAAFCLALGSAYYLHDKANKEIAKIQD